MNCPSCNRPDTRVVDSRSAPDCTRRRRRCRSCGLRFSTNEYTDSQLAAHTQQLRADLLDSLRSDLILTAEKLVAVAHKLTG